MTSFVLDLDGVIWRGRQPIRGSAAAVADLRAAGHQVLFVTNNSSARIADVEAKLADQGIPAVGAVVSSAGAVAALVEPDQRVLCCGGPGLVEALLDRGAKLQRPGAEMGAAELEAGEVDVVVVGYHRDFDYQAMAAAATAVRRGARLLASNDDATYPSDEGLLPGSGAILASIERASGQAAVVAGKPYPPMVAAVRARCDEGEGVVVVGDRLDTDGALARALGWPFWLVLSGVARAVDVDVLVEDADDRPQRVGDDLAALVASCELLQARTSGL